MVTNSGNNNTNSNKIKNDLQMVTDKIKKSERSSNNDIDTLNRAGNVIRSTLNNTTDKVFLIKIDLFIKYFSMKKIYFLFLVKTIRKSSQKRNK